MGSSQQIDVIWGQGTGWIQGVSVEKEQSRSKEWALRNYYVYLLDIWEMNNKIEWSRVTREIGREVCDILEGRGRPYFSEARVSDDVKSCW